MSVEGVGEIVKLQLRLTSVWENLSLFT